jgi:hypothetical protein
MPSGKTGFFPLADGLTPEREPLMLLLPQLLFRDSPLSSKVMASIASLNSCQSASKSA